MSTVTKDKIPLPVSLQPSTFTDDLPDLSKMSLEEVVARFKDVEKKRTVRSEPENEQEVPRSIRYAPVELISSIGVVSSRLGVSRAVLTKCMSRQLSDWYTNSLGLCRLVDEYHDVYSKIKLRAYTTLRIQAEHPARFSYACPTEQVHTSISTIRWVLAKLTDTKSVIGIGSTDLLLVGMVWSLTTLANREWDEASIDKYFMPEVDNLSILIRDRLVDVKALREKYIIREDL